MILMLCGTSDARDLAVLIQEQGTEVLASVVTGSAAASLREAGLSVRTGRLTAGEMAALLREIGAIALVDASHPFAEEAHKSAMRAAEEAGVPYIRYERAALSYGSGRPGMTVVADYEEAALEAKRRKGSVMLTTGSKTLDIFARQLNGDPDIRMTVRMLPNKDNMVKCEDCGVGQRDIIALQGPFSKEMNMALYRHYGTTVMVTKESGAPGAVDEKVEAALELGIHVILISRPELGFGSVYSDFEGVLRQLQTLS